MSQLRIFLIGAGVIARSHTKTAQKLAEIYDLELSVFVADPVEPARLSFAEQFPNAQTFASIDEMFAIPAQKEDIAIIATPPFLHRDGAIAALRSGRHTLVEKPIAPTEAEALEINQVAKEMGLHWGECSMRLYDQISTRVLHERILEGEIGTPYHINHIYKGGWGRPGIEYQPASKWFLDKSKAGGGISVDWGVYDLANLTFLLRPTKIEVRGAWKARPNTPIDPTDVTFDVETHIGALLIFTLEDGNTVHVNYERASGTHATPEHKSEIVGTKGAFVWDWAWGSEVTCKKRFYDETENKEKEEEFIVTDEWEAEHGIDQGMRPLVAFYRSVIRGEEIPALIDENAIFNFRVLCALFEASETGKSIEVSR
jgi:predicted dehydrogenase